MINSSTKTYITCALCTVLLLVFSVPAFPHSGLPEQIAEISLRIAEDTGNPYLYMKRGELYRNHQDRAKARSDFEMAGKIAPDLPLVHLFLGKINLESGNIVAAKSALDKYLGHITDNAGAYDLRARILIQMQKPLQAANDYTRAIELTANPKPDLFLARARALAAAGPPHISEAIHSLERGMHQVGPLVVFHEAALELEIRDKRFKSALKRIDDLISDSARKEKWMEKRGNVLLLAGHPDDAKEEFKKALQSLEELPSHRRNVRAQAALEARLRAHLGS